jgi:hypothetical protein
MWLHFIMQETKNQRMIEIRMLNTGLMRRPGNNRAHGIGLYYLLRSLAITPASAIGGLLWKLASQTPFVMAGAFGVAGTFVFITTVRERWSR